MRTRALPLLVLLAFPAAASAQAGGIGEGTLSGLGRARPEGSRIAHYSSRDPGGGNADFRRIEPGQTLTLVDHRGAGIIRRWWLTIAPRNDRAIQRRLIVRCWWDNEAIPSVEVPVSDFFGMGFGEWRDYVSLPLNMTSGGYNCYWPMPFRRRARISVENRAGKAVDAFYYNIDIETLRRLPDDALYFHAQFRRTRPTQNGKPVTILETTGRGHYVGTLLSMQRIRGRGLGYLEGDERVFVDGEKIPSIIGTGTEDYFSSGWYFDTGVYSAPYHGVTIKDDAKTRINAYRWHIEDPIAFQRSLRFTIEHGGMNDAPNVDYTSVAYWYQTLPPLRFPPLPADLMPVEEPSVPRIAGIIEAESLVPTAHATAGPLDPQDMTGYSGDWSDLLQLWWRPGKPGERLTLTLHAPEARDYEIVGYFTRAEDYGDVQIRVNGVALGPLISGYNDGVVPTGPISLGRAPMKAGANEIVVEVVGKDSRSKGYLVGIDGFVLK